MKKITIMLLTVVSGFVLGGCELTQPNLIDSNLQSHIETMSILDSYVIKYSSDLLNGNEHKINESYVYVDNNNETFVVSSEDKEDANLIDIEDLVFQFERKKLYNYLFDDVWIKHEVDVSFFNIISFEKVTMKYIQDMKYQFTDEEVNYVAYLSLEDVKDSGYSVFGSNIPEEYFNVKVPLTVTFNKVEQRFTSFEFDFKPVLIQMNNDKGYTTDKEDSWIVKFEYERLNEYFDLVIDDYIIDDYVDDFEQKTLSGITELFSYDLIKGCVNYDHDYDLIKVEFVKSGIYQLSLRNFNDVGDIVVTIMDINHKVITTFNLNNHDPLTSFWNYAKGTYYVLITGNLVDSNPLDYSLIFMSN